MAELEKYLLWNDEDLQCPQRRLGTVVLTCELREAETGELQA